MFAQLTWNISDVLKASVGARYSEEEKTGTNIAARFDGRTTDLLAITNPAKATHGTNPFGPVEGIF